MVFSKDAIVHAEDKGAVMRAVFTLLRATAALCPVSIHHKHVNTTTLNTTQSRELQLLPSHTYVLSSS